MPDVGLSCPFCNAILPGSVRAGEMTTCPRCEETFKALAGRGNRVDTSGTSIVAPPASQATGQRPWSNKRIALGILAVMLTMATVTTVYALMTQGFRRANDTGLRESRSNKRPRHPDLPDDKPIPPLAPLDMDAVKYLPSNIDAVAGLHVASILRINEAQRLLRREVPMLRGNVEKQLLGRLETLTGLALSEIDHLAIGVRIADQSLSAAIRTKDEYDSARVIKALHAEVLSRGKEGTVYHFRQELLPTFQSGFMHFAGPRTLVLTWQGRKEDVLANRTGEGTIPDELADILKTRVRPRGPVWLAARLDPRLGQSINAILGLGGVAVNERALLGRVRGFAFWLSFEDGAAVRAAIQGVDEKATEEVEKYLRSKLGDKKGVIIESGEGWTTLQYRDPE